MAWLSVDEDGTEMVYETEPHRANGTIKGPPPDGVCSIWDSFDAFIAIPKGSIKKLIGRELTWADEPVELKDE